MKRLLTTLAVLTIAAQTLSATTCTFYSEVTSSNKTKRINLKVDYRITGSTLTTSPTGVARSFDANYISTRAIAGVTYKKYKQYNGYTHLVSQDGMSVVEINHKNNNFYYGSCTTPITAGYTPKPAYTYTPKEAVLAGTGSGYFINPTTLVTNDHVIDDCTKITARNNGFNSVVTLIATDSTNDVAVLKAVKNNSSYLPFKSGRNVRLATDIAILGYPRGSLLGTDVKISKGIVSSLSGTDGDASQMQVSAAVQPGNSGGPMVTLSGEVVGTVVATLKKDIRVGFVIKNSTAQQFLDIYNVDYSETSNGTILSGPDLADKVSKSTVQVMCYK